MLPGSRFGQGYRTTTTAFKWIMLIAILGTLVFVFVLNKALNDSDEMNKRTEEHDPSGLGLIKKERVP